MEKDTIDIINLLVILFFVAIPTAARFYPSKIPDFLNFLPLNFITTWLRPIGIFLVGFSLGRYYSDWNLKKRYTIEGCIKKDGILWRGTATVSNDNILDIHLPYEPRCPDCKTEMKGDNGGPAKSSLRKKPSYDNTRSWICPDDKCGHSAERSGNQKQDAKKLFERHIEKIVNTTDKEYSLNCLVREIDGDVTGKDIWGKYTEVVDNPYISDDCF